MRMSEELLNAGETNFTHNDARGEEWSLYRAVQRVLMEGDDDMDSLATNLAYMLGAILENFPKEEVVRVLNVGSIRTWRAIAYSDPATPPQESPNG